MMNVYTTTNVNSSVIRRRQFAQFFILAVPFLVMILLTGLNFRLILDESFFHLRVINGFAADWPKIRISDYSSASTPLPYILWTLFGKLIGFEIWKLRLITVLISYMSIMLFFRICMQHNLPSPFFSSLLLLFFPYIFFHSHTVYTVNFGLFFGLWALHYYLSDNVDSKGILAGSLLATFAIYCRQYYLVLPLGMLIFQLLQTTSHPNFLNIKKQICHSFIYALPIIFVLPLFLLWGGLTPPMHQTDHFIRPVIQHLNYFPIFAGFYFFPMILTLKRDAKIRLPKLVLPISLILLIAYYLFPIVYIEKPNTIAATTGIIAHALHIVEEILTPYFALPLKLILWITGFSLTVKEIIKFPWTPFKTKLFCLLIAFLVLITLTPYVNDRYYTLIFPYLILLYSRNFNNRSIPILCLMYQITLAISYTYYQIYIKSW